MQPAANLLLWTGGLVLSLIGCGAGDDFTPSKAGVLEVYVRDTPVSTLSPSPLVFEADSAPIGISVDAEVSLRNSAPIGVLRVESIKIVGDGAFSLAGASRSGRPVDLDEPVDLGPSEVLDLLVRFT